MGRNMYLSLTKLYHMDNNELLVTDPYVDWKGRLCVSVHIGECQTDVYEIIGMFDEKTFQLQPV